METSVGYKNASPYRSLAILAIPFAIVEPAKLASVAILGAGHSLTGVVIITSPMH